MCLMTIHVIALSEITSEVADTRFMSDAGTYGHTLDYHIYNLRAPSHCSAVKNKRLGQP